jgi:uncharacterized protein (TIGR02996 family)
MSEDEGLLCAIADPREGLATRLVYADWLEERADPRGLYLRAELEWAQTREPSGEDNLQRLARGLDPVWVARVSRPPVGVCCDLIRFVAPGEPRPTLTPADLDWVERRFQLTLPADYRAFLLLYNGGNPSPDHFRIPGHHYDPGRYEAMNNFCSVWSASEPEIDSDFDLVWRLVHLDEYRQDEPRWRGEPHRDLMVVGLMPPGGDLDWICLGCRGAVLGQVFAVAAWLADDNVVDRALVAPSFAAFLDLLTDHDLPHIQAIKTGELDDLRHWLDAGGDVNEVSHRGPLIWHAVMSGQPAVVRELLARGARVWGSLHTDAQRLGNREVVKLLRTHASRGGGG